MHNGLIDKRPALIAECRGVADVVDAVKFARDQGLEIAVRGGGHNVGGRATVDGGVMIDLSQMRGVHVDPATRTAQAEGGTLWKIFNRETQVHGLATTGGVVGTTGIGGLTLGGGLGWLMPKHGMALDNLKSVDLVLADGKVARASALENQDLFWAVRGGGGNFGIATSFEFALHPIGPMVMGGLAAWPVALAKDVLRLYRDLCAKATDDLMLVGALLTAPDGKTKVVAIGAGHFGSKADGEKALATIKAFKQPIMDELGPLPYVAINGLLDGAFPTGARNYWKSHFLNELSDDAMARGDRRGGGLPVADGADRLRALPRRRHARAGRRRPPTRSARRASTRSSSPSGSIRRTTTRASRGARRATRRSSRSAARSGTSTT